MKFVTGKTYGSRGGPIAGSPNADGHIEIVIDGVTYLAHHLAFLAMTGAMPEGEVEHINGDPSDNRWCNLRLATPASEPLK